MKPYILIVDDDHDVRMASIEILEEAGYPVIGATQASDAMLKLEAHPSVTLLFTDINMPGVNGYVLADMAVRRWPDLRVLYTTGGYDSRLVGQQPGLLHGEMLAKPYRAAGLTAAIARCLTRPRPSNNTWGRRLETAARAPPRRLVNEDGGKIGGLPDLGAYPAGM